MARELAAGDELLVLRREVAELDRVVDSRRQVAADHRVLLVDFYHLVFEHVAGGPGVFGEDD